MLSEKEELRYALEEAKKSQSSSNINKLNEKIDSFNYVYTEFKDLQAKNEEAKKLIADSKTTIEHRFTSAMFKDLTLASDKEKLESEIENSKKVLDSFKSVPELRNQFDVIGKRIDILKDKVQLFKEVNNGLDATMKKVEDAKFESEKLEQLEQLDKKELVATYKKLVGEDGKSGEIKDIKENLAKPTTTVSINDIKNANDELSKNYEELKVEYDK